MPTERRFHLLQFLIAIGLAFALMGALDYRRRTGKGQHLDISQYEASIHFLAPAIVDYMSSGNVMKPAGNRSQRHAPHEYSSRRMGIS